MSTTISTPELHARVEQDVKTICNALGYDLNTVEFAIKDGIPYAIDFMNPAPDAELASVGEYNHRWIVNTMTDFILKKLDEGWDMPEYRWTGMLNLPAAGRAAKTEAVETKAAPADTKTAPKAKAKTAKAKVGKKPTSGK